MRFTIPELRWLLGLALCIGLVNHCAAGPTIKTVFDLGVELCELTLREHPELLPPGQVASKICQDAAFVQPFIDQLLSAQKTAAAKIRVGDKPAEPVAP